MVFVYNGENLKADTVPKSKLYFHAHPCLCLMLACERPEKTPRMHASAANGIERSYINDFPNHEMFQWRYGIEAACYNKEWSRHIFAK